MSEQDFCLCGCHDLEYGYKFHQLCSLCNDKCKLKYTKPEQEERSNKHFIISFIIGMSAFPVVFNVIESNIVFEGRLMITFLMLTPLIICLAVIFYQQTLNKGKK